MSAFPRQFPEGSVKSVRDYVTGNNMDRMKAAAAAYDVVGFALYNAAGGNHPVSTVSSIGAGVPDRKAIAKELNRMLDSYAQHNEQVSMMTDEGEASQPPQLNLNIPNWFLAFIIDFLKSLVIT